MLHVWLRAQHSALAVWHEETQRWQAVDGWQQLYSVYSHYKSGNQKAVCLYFPSSHALQIDTTLSAPQLKQLGDSGKQYLFEETSLTPVEQLAVRQWGQAQTTTHLYALAQSDIDAWQQSAQLAGMTIAALVPDFLLLPLPEEGAGQQVTLYQDEQTMLLRQSMHQGMAVSYLPLMFDRLPQLSEVLVLPPVDLINATMSQSVASGLDDTNPSEEMDLDYDKMPASSSTISYTSQTAALIADRQLLLTTLPTTPKPIDTPERHALNFFVKSTDSQLSPYLRVAMMVALSALVLQIATDGVQWYQYNEAAAATKTEIAAQYQSWFPDERLTAGNQLKIQLQPKLLSDGQTASPHMAALAKISPLIKQSSLRAQELTMQPSALSFTLIAPDRGSLDQFTDTLIAQGLNAKLAQVNNNDQGQFSAQVTVDVVASSNTDNSAAS